ncbi:hypothetical protein [Providencia rettgeri]|uniref:hypothetical protein n=1 Tax=Providencia rettgeri TaxID=587 RepID=UPI001BA9234F|nr:hypothetical protein [Providencia rettgeri]MBS0857922.1 hypothetical protein [Providencia rettgeri]MBS0871661.1 hypothetical protein [Providencia rettgeri]MBS0918808.1 hypothetical protein [Providencia rettgeri]
MDKSRQQFEAFIKKETGFDLHRTKFPMTKREDQQYSSHQTNLAWLSWQASRESLEVELPDKYTLEYMQDDLSDSECDFFKCKDVENMLNTNGVKIKDE